MSEERLYRELGRLCVSYSRLEGQIRMMIIDLATDEEVAVRVQINKKGFGVLLRLLGRSLALRVADAEIMAVYGELESALRWCQEGRNTYMHSDWHTSDPSIPYLRIKDRLASRSGKLNSTWQAVGTDGIQTLVRMVEQTQTGLTAFMLALQARGYAKVFDDIGPERDDSFPVSYEGPEPSVLENKPWREYLQVHDAEMMIAVEE